MLTKSSGKRNGEFVGAGLARDSLHVRAPVADKARSYKKSRVEITIHFARLLGTRMLSVGSSVCVFRKQVR